MVKTPALKILLSLFLLCCAICVGANEAFAGKPLLRAARQLELDGIREKWRLEWAEPPREVCAPEDPDWMTCPCMGFAFGQAGKLVLIREIPGKKEERLELGPLFNQDGYESPGEPGDAVLRRWGVRENDNEKLFKPGFAAEVRKRPVLKVIDLGDYDRDGRASEFLLQIGTLPCGKRMSIAVGISKKRDSLHVFSSADRPDRPLVLQAWQWEKLRRAEGAVKTVSWPCADHGSDRETELELRAEKGAIKAIRRVFECRADDKRGNLISEEAF